MTQPLEPVSSHTGLDQWCHAVLDAVPVHIALLDPQGVIVLVNEAWRFALDNGPASGLEPPGCGVGVNYLAICRDAKGQFSESAIDAAEGIRAVLSGRLARFELEYPCHSPERQRWFLMTVTPLALHGRGVVVTHTDISRRKQAEITQHDNELRLQRALQATGDGLWDWDLRSDQVYYSPGYLSLTGYRPEQVAPDITFFRRLVHPDDLPDVEAHIQAHWRGEIAATDNEFRVTTASGAIRWIRGRGRVVERDARGGPLRMVGHITDITERTRMEQALRESEARYRVVVEDQTEVIARFRADGTFLFANEVYCRVFGKTAAELIGRKWQPVAHPDDLAMIETRLAELKPANPVVVIENRVFDGRGEIRWMQFINRAFFDAAGRLSEIQAVGRDISDRKQIELRQATLLKENTLLGRELIQLQEKERASLARELHDDLSQQLVAIRVHAGAIRRRAGQSDPQNRADAAAIEASASQIYSVSHRLMEGLHPRILDSAGLAEALRALLSGWSQQHVAVRPSLRLAGQLDAIGGEARIHLFRIAQECLTNVIRHARAKRARVFLGVTQRGTRRVLRLVVRDDGIGMDLGKPRPGFGLIVMRERAHNLGGEFDLSSQPDHGTRVAVEVPLAG